MKIWEKNSKLGQNGLKKNEDHVFEVPCAVRGQMLNRTCFSQNSPILDFQLAPKYYKLRDKVLHTVPGAEELSLMAQLRQNHEPVHHLQRRYLTPFHTT